jgi:microtubule-associated protein 1 light chain
MSILNRNSDNSDVKYIDCLSFNERKKKCNLLLSKYPDKIPVILEKSKVDKYLPKIDKSKLLVSQDMTVSNIIKLLKSNLKINENTSIYIIIAKKNVMVSGSQSIFSIYQEHKNDDGFLYLEYCTENVFG